MKAIKATTERKNLSGSRNCIRFQWIRLLNVNHEEENRGDIGGKLLSTLWWGESKTSERLMSATVELSMKDKNICKLRHIARGINALRIIPCYLEGTFTTSSNLSTTSTHLIFILSLTYINRVSFGRAYLCVLVAITFCNYVAALDVIQGRTPLTPVNIQENTKYIATQFYLLYFYMCFLSLDTQNDLFLFFLLVFGTSCQDYF